MAVRLDQPFAGKLAHDPSGLTLGFLLHTHHASCFAPFDFTLQKKGLQQFPRPGIEGFLRCSVLVSVPHVAIQSGIDPLEAQNVIHEPDLIQAGLQEIHAVVGEEVLIEAGEVGIRGIGGVKVKHVPLQTFPGGSESMSCISFFSVRT